MGQLEATGSSEGGNSSQKTATDRQAQGTSFKIPDTAQDKCYDAANQINCPEKGEAFFGQDAQYLGSQLNYQGNGDGTVTDLNTGLMWIKAAGSKMDYYSVPKTRNFAGYDDWRIPTIKELYSLMDFRGIDPNSQSTSANGLTPFIDTDYFDFEYGDLTQGDRIIDSQWITTSVYVSKVMNNQECFFGVNFADGRIKCYPTKNRRNNGYYLRMVRGEAYGENDFKDNGDGTVTDQSNGLMWQQSDNGEGVNWDEALGYCEELSLAGHSDWRLPNAKELQLIVDYSRSPDATNSPAIDPVFDTSAIKNEKGERDFPFFWSSTTHLNERGASNAAYVSFGRALGYINNQWLDVHGAGAQRSDPKTGSPSDFPTGQGPQGDARRAENYVRCVRGGAELVEVSSEERTFQQVPQQAPGGGPSSSNGQQNPPPEAISACSSKSAGSSCSFSAPRGTVTGSCRSIQGTLACAP